MARTRASRGFTLMELMVVLVILGTILLIVPANLYVFGASSRLEHGANLLVAAVSAAREQAILDGHPVRFEVGRYRDRRSGEWHDGFRFVFTSVPMERSKLLEEEGVREEREEAEPGEEEWLETRWQRLPAGVRLVGTSEEARRWEPLREGQEYSVTFHPDGSVEKGFAVRIETIDLDAKDEDRSYTILVNPLTVQAAAEAGHAELPQQLDAHEFGS